VLVNICMTIRTATHDCSCLKLCVVFCIVGILFSAGWNWCYYWPSR